MNILSVNISGDRKRRDDEWEDDRGDDDSGEDDDEYGKHNHNPNPSPNHYPNRNILIRNVYLKLFRKI